MMKKKKIIIAILAVLLLLAGARYAQKSYQKHQVFSNGDFLSAEEKIYGLSVMVHSAPQQSRTVYRSPAVSASMESPLP